MADRFDNLTKIPPEPAARLLAVNNARLGVKLAAPASALVPEVLRELEQKQAVVDMLRMLAVALPPREKVWWACLAARDLVNGGNAGPAIVEATEAWVYEPGEETLSEVFRLVQLADPDDETALCGTAALYADGKLGPGDLSHLEAPPGGCATFTLVAVARSLTQYPMLVQEQGRVLIDRALDIARGGQGDIAMVRPEPETEGA